MKRKSCKVASWIKKQWKAILLILFGVAFLVGNVCVLVFVDETNGQSAWLTLYSGWVSGIATIILGVIAVVQNRKYKQENDSFMQRQKEENAKFQTQQLNYTVFNNIMNQRCNFIETAKERLQTFIKNFNYRKITLWLAELQVESNNVNKMVDDNSQGALINHFYDELVCEYLDIKQFIKNDWCKSEEKVSLINALDSYTNGLMELHKILNYFQIKQTIEKFNVKCSTLLSTLLAAKNNYITWLDVDFNLVLTTKTGDIDFIKSYYSYAKEPNNG